MWGEVICEVQPEDLIKHGLIPEFVGRLPVVATLNNLDEEALVEILTRPKNALTKQYEKLFELENVKLRFNEDLLEVVAKKGNRAQIGCQGTACDT